MRRPAEQAQNSISPARRGTAWARYLALSLGLCLLVLLFVAFGLRFTRQAKARAVLTQAQSIRTAIYTVSLERSADGKLTADQTQPYGFAPEALSAILELSRSEGKLYLLQADQRGCQVERFLYVQDGCAVLFENGRDGLADRFTVYWVDFALEPVSAVLSQGTEDQP